MGDNAFEVRTFYGSCTTHELRKHAAKCDDRAKAATRDGDHGDRVHWEDRAMQFRRLARDKEFAGAD